MTADGTYATQSALVTGGKLTTEEKPVLRRFLLDGNFFIAASLATTLSKLVFKYSKLRNGTFFRKNCFLSDYCLTLLDMADCATFLRVLTLSFPIWQINRLPICLFFSFRS